MRRTALFTTMLIGMSFSMLGWTQPTADFHVAVNGSDRNPGTLERPFATIQKAQREVRKILRKGPDRDVLVYIRGGTYILDEPLVFGPKDSGSEQISVTYAAYPGEEPVLSGGVGIEGWEKVKNNLWKTQLPDVRRGKWQFRQLFADGDRLPRGRFPNGDEMLHVESVSEDAREFSLSQTPAVASLGNKETELVLITNWAISREIIEKSDGDRITTRTPTGWVGHGGCGARSGMPAYLEHAPEFVDRPGEWYLDHETGELLYGAAENENPNRRDFIAPRLQQLLLVAGRPDAPVTSLHFRGLTFAHTSWPLPKIGYAGIQAGHYGSTMGEPFFVLPLAIEYKYAVLCSLENCRVRHVGATAVGMGAGCQRNRITGCEIDDVGGNGVMIGWRGDEKFRDNDYDRGLAADWENPYDAPAGNEVTNCYVHNTGATLFGAVGIYDAFCINTRIAHNRLEDLPYTGISVGYRWDTVPSSQRGCIVEYNHISDIMKKVADGGGIYTLGFQPGTVLRGNLIHNVHRSAYAHGGAPNNGIFFDQGSSSLLVEDQIIYDTSGKPIRFNQCKHEDQRWRDNSLGVGPGDPNFPSKDAGKAGPLPEYREFLY